MGTFRGGMRFAFLSSVDSPIDPHPAHAQDTRDFFRGEPSRHQCEGFVIFWRKRSWFVRAYFHDWSSHGQMIAYAPRKSIGGWRRPILTLRSAVPKSS
jgi:hypothetical protein